MYLSFGKDLKVICFYKKVDARVKNIHNAF